MNWKRKLRWLSAVSSLFLCPAAVWGQAATVNFVVTDTATWNDASNWNPTFIPGDDFSIEVAGIDGGGTAFLDAMAGFPIDGLVFPGTPGMGTLEIRNGGSLTVQNGGGGRHGEVIIGNGPGLIDLTGNGTLNTELLTVSASGEISLSDTSSLNVAPIPHSSSSVHNGDLSLGGILRIHGPNVSPSVAGSMTMNGGSIVYQITGPTDSKIAVTGTANLNGGNVTIQSDGYTPVIGDSWTILTSNNLIGLLSSVSVPTVGPGLDFEVKSNPAAGTLTASLINKLTLMANRQTGKVTVKNIVADTDLKGYTISSPSGAMNQAGWSSLASQPVVGWDEANPTVNDLSELNLSGSTLISTGGTLNIGNAWTPPSDPITFFGQPVIEDLQFEYVTASGTVLDGFVEYAGDVLVNNLVLRVDPTSGAAQIRNPSPFDVEINGYVVQSNAGSLAPNIWNSLSDQGDDGGNWSEATTNEPNRLAELNLLGMKGVNSGTNFLMGNPFRPGFEADLSFDFSLVDGTVMPGLVEYATILALGCDFDGDTLCDVDDINLMYQQGDLVAGVSVGGGNQFDLNGDMTLDNADLTQYLSDAATENGYRSPFHRGDSDDVGPGTTRDVDITDFNALANNFSPSGGSVTVGNWHQGNFDGDGDIDITDFNSLASSFASSGYSAVDGQSVPEPATVSLLLTGLLGAAALWFRRRTV